jgi:hypothetical protein
MSGPGQGDGPDIHLPDEALTRCPMCRRQYPLPFGPRPNEGRRIQDQFPKATAAQRETYLTGLCSDDCWNRWLRGVR